MFSAGRNPATDDVYQGASVARSTAAILEIADVRAGRVTIARDRSVEVFSARRLRRCKSIML